MASTESAQHRSWPAIIGWGSLIVFSVAFVWVISRQLGETWAKKEKEAIELVKNFKPGGPDQHTLYDLTRMFTIKAREKDHYVGEFTWDAKQKEGPVYEVTLMWKEGENRRVAVFLADLKTGEVRPQGDEAASLPRRARAGGD